MKGLILFLLVVLSANVAEATNGRSRFRSRQRVQRQTIIIERQNVDHCPQNFRSNSRFFLVY